jgi:hypothetical protein
MKVRDTHGKQYTWPPDDCLASEQKTANKSGLHIKCRSVLFDIYPGRRLLEEVPLPGEGLFLDFYIPHRKVAVEVQGEQHFNYIPHFHGSKFNFIKSQERDARKREWCETNGIELIEVRFDEDEEAWSKKLE